MIPRPIRTDDRGREFIELGRGVTVSTKPVEAMFEGFINYASVVSDDDPGTLVSFFEAALAVGWALQSIVRSPDGEKVWLFFRWNR